MRGKKYAIIGAKPALWMFGGKVDCKCVGKRSSMHQYDRYWTTKWSSKHQQSNSYNENRCHEAHPRRLGTEIGES